jgi:hypothetical protein
MSLKEVVCASTYDAEDVTSWTPNGAFHTNGFTPKEFSHLSIADCLCFTYIRTGTRTILSLKKSIPKGPKDDIYSNSRISWSRIELKKDRPWTN